MTILRWMLVREIVADRDQAIEDGNWGYVRIYNDELRRRKAWQWVSPLPTLSTNDEIDNKEIHIDTLEDDND